MCSTKLNLHARKGRETLLADERLPSQPPIKLAVYGTLRDGEYNHHYLKGAWKVSDGYLHGYEMVDGGCYPLIIPGKPHQLITVELYKVPRESYDRIYQMERGVGYRADVATVCTPLSEIPAMVFVYGNPEHPRGFPRILGGDWKHR